MFIGPTSILLTGQKLYPDVGTSMTFPLEVEIDIIPFFLSGFF